MKASFSINFLQKFNSAKCCGITACFLMSMACPSIAENLNNETSKSDPQRFESTQRIIKQSEEYKAWAKKFLAPEQNRALDQKRTKIANKTSKQRSE